MPAKRSKRPPVKTILAPAETEAPAAKAAGRAVDDVAIVREVGVELRSQVSRDEVAPEVPPLAAP